MVIREDTDNGKGKNMFLLIISKILIASQFQVEILQ